MSQLELLGAETGAELEARAVSRRTLELEHTALRRWTAYALEHGIDEPTAREAVAFLGSLVDDGCSASTVATYRSLLGRTLPAFADARARAVARGASRALRPAEPARPIRLPEVHRLYTSTQVRTPWWHVHYDVQIVLSYWCALRVSEAAALHLRDSIRVESDRVIVTLEARKRDEDRVVVAPALPSDHPYREACPVRMMRVRFANDAHYAKIGPISARSCSLYLSQLLEICGELPSSWHGLRAGFVSDAAVAGATDLQIALQTKHRSTSSVARYSRPDRAVHDGAARAIINSTAHPRTK